MARLNRSQRISLVVGWGLLLWRSAIYVEARLRADATQGGWVNYGPNVPTDAYRDTGNLWVWIASVVLWVIVALLLLHSPRDSAE